MADVAVVNTRGTSGVKVPEKYEYMIMVFERFGVKGQWDRLTDHAIPSGDRARLMATAEADQLGLDRVRCLRRPLAEWEPDPAWMPNGQAGVGPWSHREPYMGDNQAGVIAEEIQRETPPVRDPDDPAIMPDPAVDAPHRPVVVNGGDRPDGATKALREDAARKRR